MSPLVPQIVAFGGGGFSMEWGNRLLDEYVLGLTGVDCPRVCFLPTASGDADHCVVRFYRAFDSLRCRPSHISLFRREPVRREEYHRALASGMRPGYAADDGAALHFIGGELADVVTSRPGAGAFHVQSVGGEAIESPLAARFLGRPEVLAA
jgi:peptidase E